MKLKTIALVVAMTTTLMPASEPKTFSVNALSIENNSPSKVVLHTSSNFNSPVDKHEIPAGTFHKVNLGDSGKLYLSKDKYLYTIEYPKPVVSGKNASFATCDINTILFLAHHLPNGNIDALTIINDTFYPVTVIDANAESDLFDQKISLSPHEAFTKNVSVLSKDPHAKETQSRHLLISYDGSLIPLTVPARVYKKGCINTADYREAVVQVSTLALFHKKGFSLKSKGVAMALAKQRSNL